MLAMLRLQVTPYNQTARLVLWNESSTMFYLPLPLHLFNNVQA